VYTAHEKILRLCHGVVSLKVGEVLQKTDKNKYKIANIMVRHAAHLYFPRSINRRTAERSLPLVLGPDSHVVAGPNRSSHLLLNLLFATSELLTFSQPYLDQVHLSFANKRYR